MKPKIVVSVLLIFLISAFCTFAKSGSYIDGIYEGGHSFVKVKVVVKGGNICDIEILEHGGGGEKYADMIKPLKDEVIRRQSTNVAAITGATVSSKNFKKAVDNALQKAAPMTLTEKDNNGTFKLRDNQNFQITLPGNPTTGYSWNIISIDPKTTKQVDKKEYEPDSERIGAGGHVRFRFKATGKGKTVLKLAYYRVWEKNVPYAKTFTVNLSVE